MYQISNEIRFICNRIKKENLTQKDLAENYMYQINQQWNVVLVCPMSLTHMLILMLPLQNCYVEKNDTRKILRSRGIGNLIWLLNLFISIEKLDIMIFVKLQKLLC